MKIRKITLGNTNSINKRLQKTFNTKFTSLNKRSSQPPKPSEDKTSKNSKDITLFNPFLSGILDDYKNDTHTKIINLAESEKINNLTISRSYNQLQNNAGTSIEDTIVAIDPNTGTKIRLSRLTNPNKSTTYERTESYPNGTIASRYLNSDRSFISIPQFIKYGEIYIKTLKLYAEIIYDNKTKEPTAILVSKKSDTLPGVFEKTLYTLANYDEDYDVLGAICNDTIKGGKKLSRVKQNTDGTITYQENLTINGCNIKRKYTKGANNIDYDYSFQIINENGEKILNTAITFTKNSENQTTTTINGITYTARFDDKTKTIKISNPDKVETIDFNQISPDNENHWHTVKKLPANLIRILKNAYWTENEANESPYMYPPLFVNTISENKISYNIDSKEGLIEIKQTYNEEDDTISIMANTATKKIKYNPDNHTLEAEGTTIQLNKNITKNLLKQIPLFYIFNLIENNADTKKISEYISKNINGNIAYVATNEKTIIIMHELGHVLDNSLGILNLDKVLIDLYNKEITEFNSKYTNTAGKKQIAYLSQTGGNSSTGLSELIAETHMLLNTYGNQDEDSEFRSQFLVQNFPRTMTYIATKFGLNNIY